MEVCSEWEIYIPMEAEVKNIPLKSLPKSVVRRIGLHISDIDSSSKPDSSDVIWICPAVIGRKGQGSALHKGKDLAENTLAFLASESQGGPFKMSFVSSNRAARDVFKNISAGKPSSNKEHLCQDSTQLANQNAVVVYKGQIYLCIRRRPQMTPGLKSSSQAAIPSTSGLPSTSFAKELISGKRKIKADAGKVKRCEKAGELKRKNDSAARAENSAPRPPHSRHRAESKSRCNKAARKELSSEGTLRSSYTQPQENQKDPTKRVSREYEVNDLGEEEDSVYTNDMDSNQMDSQEDECNGSVGQMEPLGAAAETDCDFNELKQEEMIAHLKARFMQNEAALSDLIRTAP